MLTIHAVEIAEDLPNSSPLHVSKFFSLSRMRWAKRKMRQNMILGIASAWLKLTNKNKGAYGFIEEEVYLTALSKQLSDARVIFDKFFIVKSLGYNFNSGLKSATKVVPRKLNGAILREVKRVSDICEFYPGPEPKPDGLTVSKTSIQANRFSFIVARLKEDGRDDLIPAIRWLYKHEDGINFYFKPSGKLQARDTSVWPIRAIELWPGWLRTEVFGTVVDLSASFCQFVIYNLKKKYNDEKMLDMKYPDILKLMYDKGAIRNELCANYLKMDNSAESMKIVKSVIMALANGSNCSGNLMICEGTRSVVAQTIRQSCPHLTLTELFEVGERLQSIAKQFRRAKRAMCYLMFNQPPNKDRIRQIFQQYMMWEREARYSIWKTLGSSGLHLHDGIDGIIDARSEKDIADQIFSETGLHVTVDKPLAVN